MRENDEQYRLVSLKEVKDHGDSFVVTDNEGWSLSVENPKRLPIPKVGSTAKMYGEGIGRPVRGFESGGVVYYYRTEAEEQERHEEWCRKEDQRRKKQWDDKWPETRKRIEALPEALRARLDRFMSKKDWAPTYGLYEIFCCEEAVEIHDCLKDAETILEFPKLSVDEQKIAVPTLRMDEHSGNTFGASVRLAYWLAKDPAMLIKEHGALCPLTGCEEPMCLLNEEWAQNNHGQSLDRLAERGGLSPDEALAIMEQRPWIHEPHALEKIFRLVIDEAEAQVAFWMGEGKPISADDAEWRRLAAIDKKQRTESQTRRLRALARKIMHDNDERRIPELEAKCEKLRTALIYALASLNERGVILMPEALDDVGITRAEINAAKKEKR